jgi:hypothetical protein
VVGTKMGEDLLDQAPWYRQSLGEGDDVERDVELVELGLRVSADRSIATPTLSQRRLRSMKSILLGPRSCHS